jgi:hypothetical protein
MIIIGGIPGHVLFSGIQQIAYNFDSITVLRAFAKISRIRGLSKSTVALILVNQRYFSKGRKAGVVIAPGGTGLAVRFGMNKRLPLKIRVALKMAQRIGTSARFLRRELRDHNRNELLRIQLAEKRARGLRLYAAWAMRQSSKRVPQSRLLEAEPAKAALKNVQLVTFRH